MAKKRFKSARLQEIIKNIASDFRFSGEIDEYALLFYKADESKEINGNEIDKMREYVTTGLEELQNSAEYKQSFMSENQGFNETQMLNNLKTIEREYQELLMFLE